MENKAISALNLVEFEAELGNYMPELYTPKSAKRGRGDAFSPLCTFWGGVIILSLSILNGASDLRYFLGQVSKTSTGGVLILCCLGASSIEPKQK